MTARAKREAEVAVRWREQMARLIAEVNGPERAAAECSECFGTGQAGADESGAADDGEPCDACLGRGDALGMYIAAMLRGEQHFDVHLAREYGERLVAMEAEQAAFEDWTRTQGYKGCPPGVGMGPENRERGTFIAGPLRVSDGRGGDIPIPMFSGGWPGPLAREYGWRECEACEGDGFTWQWEWAEWRSAKIGRVRETAVKQAERDGWDVAVHEMNGERGLGADGAVGYRYTLSRRKLARCKPCKGRGRVRKHGKPPGFANGRSLARLGHRLLSALEGQPSECQHPACRYTVTTDADDRRWARIGRGWVSTGHPGNAVEAESERLPGVTLRLKPCPDCHGTGHNLSGVLPPVVDSPATCRAALDGIEAAGQRDPARWQRDVAERWGRSMVGPPFVTRTDDGERIRAATRVVPRGEHRRYVQDAGPNGRPLRDIVMGEHEATQVTVRLADENELADAHVRAYLLTRLPGWRRGELLHAEQRRERARRRRGTAIAGTITGEMARLGRELASAF